MHELDEFAKAYFIQTRSEIDTEKRERDQMLNFAILVLGAIGFAICGSGEAQTFLRQPEALAVEVPALAIVSSLLWVRRKKLQQIADRWFVLERMALRHFGQKSTGEMLEGVVCRNLTTWRYIAKDFVLNFILSSPIYGLLILQMSEGLGHRQPWRAVLAAALLISHAATTGAVFGRTIRNPLPELSLLPADADVALGNR
ncbi:MAG: hypothetical protein ACE149_07030 [Armatimonadota bacterium]